MMVSSPMMSYAQNAQETEWDYRKGLDAMANIAGGATGVEKEFRSGEDPFSSV